MSRDEPVEIAGETFEPVVVVCPGEYEQPGENEPCGERIDAQRVLYEGKCPHCGTPVRELVHGAESPPDEEHDAHLMEA